MKINNEITERIKSINWFVNCGKPLERTISFNIHYINNSVEVVSLYKNTKWEDTVLEARNELTSFLHQKYINKYCEWNRLVREAKEFIKREVTPIIQEYVYSNNYDEIFINCVEWDILNVIMEYTYSECKNRPTFFLELLTIYESGNFPCGWEGKYPNGSILVF